MNSQQLQSVKHDSHSHVSWYQYFGLYDQIAKTPLPLKRISVNARVNDYISEVTYSQLYYNPNATKLETDYFFPISNTACFHGFKAKFGNTTIEGVIKKKEEAKKDYDKHNQEGNLVAYAEIVDQNYSVLCVKIGNIPPSSEIEIIFSYIERLEISLNKFWRFTLYAAIVAKSEHEHFLTANAEEGCVKNSALSDYPVYAKDIAVGLAWDINIQVDSRSPITFIKSTSHDVEITQSQQSKIFSAKVTLAKAQAYTPNKDFVLLYATDSIHKPSYLLSPFEEGYCTLINFFPEISYMSFDDAYMASLQGKDPLEEMIKSAKNEFVFVVDKNASMGRKASNLLVDSLTYFLQSLPADSYCNVIVIGDPNSGAKSLRTSKEVVDDLVKKEKEAVPSSGKSQIIETLENIGKTDLITGYSRLVFLLTNGQIDTPVADVTKTIKDKFFKTRVFVLGIGESSVTDFTKKTANEGYGSYEVVRTSDEIPEKVTHLLKSSIVPYFTDFELKIENESLFSYVVPLPKCIGCISPNELVEFFVVFNKKLDTAKKTTFTLRFFNGFNHRNEEFKQDIDVECADLSEAVVKLGMLKFCESLVKKKEIYEAMGSGEVVKSFKEDVQRSLVSTSLRHGILTSETSFVCLVKEGDDITRQIPAEKIVIGAHDPSQEGGLNVVSLSRDRKDIHKKETRILSPDLDVIDIDKLSPPIESEKPTTDQKPIITPKKADQKVPETSSLEKVSPKPSKKSLKPNKTIADTKKDLLLSLNQISPSKTYSNIFSTSGKGITSPKSSRGKQTGSPTKQIIPQTLPYLIKLQQLKGYWEPQVVIGTILGYNLAGLMKKAPEELQSLPDKERIWLTILVLVWIQHYSFIEAEWEPAFKKAVTWLQEKGENYENYVESAKAVLRF